MDNNKDYKPYTTPYTGTGAIKTEQGWVSSRDLGAPGAASGPGKRRDSGPLVPPFHHAELTPTTVSPPAGHEKRGGAVSQRKRSMSMGARTPRSGPISYNSRDIKGIQGPGGVGFDLPSHHNDLPGMSNREIALKIGLLHIKKGNIHEAMHQAATNRDILSREPHEQFKFRDENTRQLSEVLEAIRAWEDVQATRAGDLLNPGLVDMLMISQDYCEKEESKDHQSLLGRVSSPSNGPGTGGKKKSQRYTEL
ncbi:hypothetical protein F4777DRAFT_482239 [Nemania sp. FL0916]|nr:hypothetical protein F4777DRAFT_482239 [Nemania sp. FL0916]